jgi:hypothetical protein
MLRMKLAVSCLPLIALLACGDSGSTATGGSDTGGSGPGPGGGGSTTTGGGMGGGTGGVEGGSGPGPGGGPSAGGGGEGGGTAPCSRPTNNVPKGNCDLYLQDCPVETDTCEIVDGPEAGYNPISNCITKNGLKGIGESCSQPEDCEAYLTCVGDYCTPFCCPDNEAQCVGGSCNLNVTLNGPNGMPVQVMENGMLVDVVFKACTFPQACNLFDPESCPSDENCYLDDPGVTGCFPLAGDTAIAEGQPCVALNDCADSSICIDDGGGDVCRYMCEGNSNMPPGLGGCPAGQLCDTNSLDTGFANVGFCHP